jgi:hypothetical protein
MTPIEQLIKDVNSHGILFNFKDAEGKIKTGIIRKGQYHDGLFKNGFVPKYRKMTRKERRHL